MKRAILPLISAAALLAPVSLPLLSFRVDDDRWILCDFETVDLLALAREVESDPDARYVFLVTHGPLTAPDAASWRWSLSGWPNKGGCGRGVQELFEAVSRRRAIVLSGHMHWTAFFRLQGGPEGILPRLRRGPLPPRDLRREGPRALLPRCRDRARPRLRPHAREAAARQ